MSSDEIAIRVSNLTKSYQIYEAPRDRLKQFVLPRLQRMAGQAPKQYYREFHALNNVSFDIWKGETVGIIGRNGSGKSTLLQIICGTLNPTAGSITTNGRIAALLELGSGFNPEFTGRENVYMNGAILGLSRDDIDARFDEIAAFADIGAFMEQPVKILSSGMFVRLAFASNIMSDPEIMIVDEALSVGDMNFQAKCMTALTRIQESGATVLFVTHDVGTVKSLCSRCVYLDGGKVMAVGQSADVTERYIRAMREEMNEEHRRFVRVSAAYSAKTPTPVAPVENRQDLFKICPEFEQRVAQFRYGSGEVRVTAVELLDTQGNSVILAEFNQSVKVQIYFEAYAEKTISVNFSIFDEKKNNIIGSGFPHVGQPYLTLKGMDRYLVEYDFKLPLQEGSYSIRINISSSIVENESAEFVDVVTDALVFKIGRWKKARVWSKVHAFPELTLHKFETEDERGNT